MDFIAGILELSGLYLVGNKSRIGFVLNLLGCLVWIYVAVTTNLYGLLLVVIPAVFINIRNWTRWKNGI